MLGFASLRKNCSEKWRVSMETNVCVAEEVLPTQSAFFKPIMYCISYDLFNMRRRGNKF